jgi:hypothetical protein
LITERPSQVPNEPDPILLTAFPSTNYHLIYYRAQISTYYMSPTKSSFQKLMITLRHRAIRSLSPNFCRRSIASKIISLRSALLEYNDVGSRLLAMTSAFARSFFAETLHSGTASEILNKVNHLSVVYNCMTIR